MTSCSEVRKGQDSFPAYMRSFNGIDELDLEVALTFESCTVKVLNSIMALP